MLVEEPELELAGEAVDAQRLLALAESCGVDLVVMDRELPGLPIGTLITRLHMLKPRPTVIVMSSRIEDGSKMLRAGADVFITKGDPPDWLLQTLRQYARRTGDAGAAA